jgi:hypothetical protein
MAQRKSQRHRSLVAVVRFDFQDRHWEYLVGLTGAVRGVSGVDAIGTRLPG